MTSKPSKDMCLFYTRRTLAGETQSLSTTAQCYAKDNKLTTIWVRITIIPPSVWRSHGTDSPIQDHWPNSGEKDYYAMKDTGWLRCINANPAQRTTYFEHMSEAFARACEGDIYVMTDDPKKLPTEGIWPKTEYPILITLDTTQKITAMDIKGGNRLRIWPEDTGAENTKEIFQIIGKRATDCPRGQKLGARRRGLVWLRARRLGGDIFLIWGTMFLNGNV